jgi:hypothetical protein
MSNDQGEAIFHAAQLLQRMRRHRSGLLTAIDEFHRVKRRLGPSRGAQGVERPGREGTHRGVLRRFTRQTACSIPRGPREALIIP